MIVEVGLLLAGAETAISTIKRAMAVGKDAHSLMKEFTDVFDAQDAIIKQSNAERAKIKAKDEEERSAMSEAMDSVMAARKIQMMMADLQQYITWEMQEPQLWQNIMLERNAVIQRRKAAALAAEKARKARARRLRNIAEYTAVGVGAFILLCLILYGLYIYITVLKK